MNSFVKGGIAAAAGLALLLGGAGSLAYWSDTESLNAGTVNSGTLTLDSNADGAWDETITNIVPGDVITYTETFDIEAVGDNLDAELSTNIGLLTVGIAGVDVDETFTLLDSDSNPVSAVGGVYELTPDTYTLTVEIVVTFPWAETGGMDASLDLTDIEISLTQV